MNVLSLIEEMEDIIEDSPSLPLSNKVMINREELLDIIKDIRINLPDEIKQALWIRDEKQAILEEAKKEADNIVNEAEYKLEELIDKEEVVKKAVLKAEELIISAQNNAKEIRLGAIEYADSILHETQENITKTLNEITNNRKELRGD